MQFYKEAKMAKDYDKVDQIRTELKKLGIVLKDMKNQIDCASDS